MRRKTTADFNEKRAGLRRPETLYKRLQYCSAMLYIYGVLSDKEKQSVVNRIVRGAQKFV